jgi:hypothetical protein
MLHDRRRNAVLLATIATASVMLAGCPAGEPTASPTPTTATSLTPSAAPPVAKAPTCAEVREGTVGGLIDPYYAYDPAGAPLSGGMFSGADGLVFAVQEPCATGDLGGDIGNVTVATVMNSVENTTGRFWNVMLCTPGEGRAKCRVNIALNDRDPIESVSVSGQKLTLVYLTRPDGGAMAAVSVRRTAIYTAVGTVLTEQSHTDTPYTP